MCLFLCPADLSALLTGPHIPRGNLATKSLTPIVDPALLVQDSEYLETHLIVVPSSAQKEFVRGYETLSPMVVPRSCIQVAQDDEFTLFAVTTFKKYSAEFLHKCREQKWTPRQYKYVEGGKEEEQKELEKFGREEKKVWGEALLLGRTGWGESVMIWIHVLTLRVFVETVLRYGLPLEYISALVQVRILLHVHTVGCGRRQLISGHRPRQNRPKRSRQHWITHIHTWVEMRSGKIKEGVSQRTMPP